MDQHLRTCSNHATYKSEASVDEFLKCLSKHLGNEFLNQSIVASDFTLITDETTNMDDRCQLVIFVRYTDSEHQEMEQEFLGMVEIVGSKGVEAL